MTTAEELQNLVGQVQGLQDRSTERIMRCNRLDRAMCSIRLAFAGCGDLGIDELQERVTDTLVIASNPHDTSLWPKHLQPDK